MKKRYFLLKWMPALAVIVVLSGFPANRLYAGEYGENTLISAMTAHSPTVHPLTAIQSVSNGDKTLANLAWSNYMPLNTPATRPFSARYFTQAGFLKAAGGFKSYMSSLRPDIQYSEDTHTQEVFLVLHLDTLLSPGVNMVKSLEGGEQLSAMLMTPAALIFPDNIRLKPNLSASVIKNPESSAAMTAHHDLVFKPFIRNPFQNGAISLSLPIALTESLTISPAITYAFSIYDNVRQEYRGKAVINLIDKDSAIVYTGILLKYTF